MKTLRYRGRPTPVLGFAGYSGSGKTTLIKQLVASLKDRGQYAAIVKHAHHAFDIDHPGKDSYEFRKAGAAQVLVGSAERWALITETRATGEAELSEFLSHLAIDDCDIVLVEGFRDARFPKIEVHRRTEERPLFYPDDEFIISLVTDCSEKHAIGIPVFDHGDVKALTEFVQRYCALATSF